MTHSICNRIVHVYYFLYLELYGIVNIMNFCIISMSWEGRKFAYQVI